MLEELSKTTQQAKFPPSFTLEILPSKIMKSYTIGEKHLLFIDNDTTPVVRAFNNRRNNRQNNENQNIWKGLLLHKDLFSTRIKKSAQKKPIRITPNSTISY